MLLKSFTEVHASKSSEPKTKEQHLTEMANKRFMLLARDRRHAASAFVTQHTKASRFLEKMIELSDQTAQMLHSEQLYFPGLKCEISYDLLYWTSRGCWGVLGKGVSIFLFLPTKMNNWDASYFFTSGQTRKLLTKSEAKRLEADVNEEGFMCVEVFEKVINNMAIWAEQTTNVAQANELRDMGKILIAFYYKVSQAARSRLCPWLAIFKMVDMLLEERTLYLDAVIVKSAKIEGFDVKAARKELMDLYPYIRQDNLQNIEDVPDLQLMELCSEHLRQLQCGTLDGRSFPKLHLPGCQCSCKWTDHVAEAWNAVSYADTKCYFKDAWETSSGHGKALSRFHGGDNSDVQERGALADFIGGEHDRRISDFARDTTDFPRIGVKSFGQRLALAVGR